MNKFSKIELQVEQATAAALSDPNRREAVSRLVDSVVRPGGDDTLIERLNRAAAEQAAPSQPQAKPHPSTTTSTTTFPNLRQHVRLMQESTRQTILIPHGFELPGTEAIVTQEGNRLIIEPIRKRGLAAFLENLQPIDVEFPDIEDPPPAPEHVF